MTTPNDAPTAVKIAKSHTSWKGNYCLNHTWNCYGRNYGYADALAAWRATTGRQTSLTPPAGVPVYFSADYQPHGHVVISMGGGIVRSTDFPTYGLVGDVPLTILISRWNLRYLGWAKNFCGDPIANVPGSVVVTPAPTPVVTVKPTLRVGSTGALVKSLQNAFINYFPSYASPIVDHGGADGVYGSYTALVVSEFQRRSGLFVDGICGAQTWTALDKSGIKVVA